jgi:hypothetical protein
MDKISDSDALPPTKKPKTKGFKDTAGRLRQGKENHLSHRASLDWRLDRELVCDVGAAHDIVTGLEDIKSVLLKSRTGEMMLNDAIERGLKIFYDPQTPQSQFYPRENGCAITLNPQRPRGDLIGMLSRELRRAWQYHRGALINPMSFEPDEAVLVNRAQQADAYMMSVRIAWELKLINEAEAWNFLAGSPMGSVTRAFELCAQEDFRSLNNGEAPRAAYDKFFEGSCTKSHDKRIIHQMLLDDAGYMKVTRKDRHADMEMFRKLGELPHGANYLSSVRGKRAPTDMCYATVEDRSNANFLWFIKFERSFQEKELQMLQASVKTSAEIIDLAAWSAHSRA